MHVSCLPGSGHAEEAPGPSNVARHVVACCLCFRNESRVCLGLSQARASRAAPPAPPIEDRKGNGTKAETDNMRRNAGMEKRRAHARQESCSVRSSLNHFCLVLAVLGKLRSTCLRSDRIAPKLLSCCLMATVWQLASDHDYERYRVFAMGGSTGFCQPVNSFFIVFLRAVGRQRQGKYNTTFTVVTLINRCCAFIRHCASYGTSIPNTLKRKRVSHGT